MTVPLLHPDYEAMVEAIAQRVVELLDERNAQPTSGVLVDATALATLLGVSRSTVYEHREVLGAIELGEGSRPRLRFDPAKALEAWTAGTTRGGSQPAEPPESVPSVRPPRRRREAAAQSSVRLLPIKGSTPDDLGAA